MAGDGEDLSEKIGEILLAGDKEDAELALIDTITKPMEQRF